MARIGKWDTADLLARSLNQHTENVDTLRLLAAVGAECGQWARATRWIDMVVDLSSRAYAALPAVQEGARTNPQWARSTCVALVESLSHLLPHFDEDIAIYHIARSMSMVDIDLARELALTIIRPSVRSRALASVAATGACNEFEKSRTLVSEAEQAAADIIDPLLQARTTAAITVILSNGYPDRTVRLADQAEKDIVRIADPITHTDVLKVWIDTAAQLGHIHQVERLVHCIPDPQTKIESSAQALTHLLKPDMPWPMHAEDLRRPPLARLIAASLRGPRWLEILPLAAKLDPRVVTADDGTDPQAAEP
jgi:hypothetical protein